LTILEVWKKGKEIVSRNYILILLPIILDLIFYGPLMARSGLNIHFKLTVPSSLPSIQNLLPDAAALGSTTGFSGIATYPGTLLAHPVTALLVSLFLIPYLTGGYLGTIAQDLKNPTERMPFTQLAGKFFTRLFIMELAMFAVMLALFPLLMVPLLNILLFVGLLIGMFLIFFWEYCLVYDDLNVFPALKKAYKFFTENFGIIAGILLPVALLLSPLSGLTSAFMYSPIFLLTIVLYGYLGAVLVSGFMSLYAALSAPLEPSLLYDLKE
jgi:hypothetical protein